MRYSNTTVAAGRDYLSVNLPIQSDVTTMASLGQRSGCRPQPRQKTSPVFMSPYGVISPGQFIKTALMSAKWNVVPAISSAPRWDVVVIRRSPKKLDLRDMYSVSSCLWLPIAQFLRETSFEDGAIHWVFVQETVDTHGLQVSITRLKE